MPASRLLGKNLDLQLRALEKAGCKKIFREKVSVSNRERPQFQRMLDQIRSLDSRTSEPHLTSSLPQNFGKSCNMQDQSLINPGWYSFENAT